MARSGTGVIRIPDCYDPVYQEELRQQKWDERIRRLPKCVGCQQPLESGRYLELTPFGLSGELCEACCRRHSRWADLLEEDME